MPDEDERAALIEQLEEDSIFGLVAPEAAQDWSLHQVAAAAAAATEPWPQIEQYFESDGEIIPTTSECPWFRSAAVMLGAQCLRGSLAA